MPAMRIRRCGAPYCPFSNSVDYRRPATSTEKVFETAPSSFAQSRSSDGKLLHQGWCVRSLHPGALRTIGVQLREPSFAKSMCFLLVRSALWCEWSRAGDLRIQCCYNRRTNRRGGEIYLGPSRKMTYF